MEFKVTVTGDRYQEPDKKLEELGFTFQPYESSIPGIKYLINDHYDEDKIKIQINTIEELVDFSKKYGQIIVDGNSIEIYNDYRE